MKILIIIVIYFLIGLFLALAPIFIDKKPFEFEDYYKMIIDRDDLQYRNKVSIAYNAKLFIFIFLLWPFVFLAVICILGVDALGKAISDIYVKRNKKS